MTTSKGTIQGYNGVAAVDKKHQVVIDAQAFGEGQEHHTLAPVLESIGARLQRLGIADNIYNTGTIVTADTGFANESNMKYLHENKINAYVPDNSSVVEIQSSRTRKRSTGDAIKIGKRILRLRSMLVRSSWPVSSTLIQSLAPASVLLEKT